MPDQADVPDNESVMAKSARLRVEFLERELDLTDTMIQLARFEYHRDESGAIRHVHQGLDTIRNFLGLVTSPEDRARITERLQRLENELAALVTSE